jgi:hypothetical protein
LIFKPQAILQVSCGFLVKMLNSMTQPPNHCPECNASLPENMTCEDHFHQMLYWEAEYPEYGIVHHLMVLCYHLQHPSLYSSQGLDVGKRLLTDFLERGLTTEEVRQRNQAQVDSGSREWKITARPDSFGVYEHPIYWTITAADVVAHGAERYVANVRDWAQSVFDALQSSGNLQPE